MDRFFDELGFDKQLQIEVAVTDMWDPYIASLNEHCPRVEIVFDKFHIMKKVNEALDDVRKKEFANTDTDERKRMKKKRFLILKRNDNLTEKQGESLRELMKRNEVLCQAYILKEQIADILDGNEFYIGLTRLNKWMDNVKESGIEPLMKCVKTINNHYSGIANYFRHNITNAASEGFNNKIGVIKRRAYGFWDLDYFMLKIKQACGLMRENVS